MTGKISQQHAMQSTINNLYQQDQDSNFISRRIDLSFSMQSNKSAYPAVLLLLLAYSAFNYLCMYEYVDTGMHEFGIGNSDNRRLSATDKQSHWYQDVPYLLSLAKYSTPRRPFRVLYIVTSLTEYDVGTRGTNLGYDRLQNVLMPPLVDAVNSMHSRGWHVDVYLILGYGPLLPERRKMVQDALPDGVGLEVWDDAIPLHYEKTFAKRPKADQMVTLADHALSRQHRFVVRDKLREYDFFSCFEDDIRIMDSHVMNFLELSADIRKLYDTALASKDGMVHVTQNRSTSLQRVRHKSNDKATFGNDVVDDPISAEHIKRLFPGLLRVEVLDRKPDHPLRANGVLDTHRFVKEIPPSSNAFSSDGKSLLRPYKCCEEDEPARGKMTAHPTIDELVMWETNIQATGVRKYPEPIGWAAAMPVEDRADVGSYWSGYPDIYGKPNMKRPRRVDETIGNQAGFMATRSQIEYFHNEACPGGFLPHFDGQHWRGDSLQRHSVEFWSGGFQLFGQCYLNRILPLETKRFEQHLIYHVSNNKQRTVRTNKFIRIGDFYGQIMAVKERAEKS